MIYYQTTVNQEEIRKEYPDKEIERRNTGYALDLLLESEAFTPGAEPFNFCRLLAGSEGTLAFTTEIKLNLVPLPPKEKALVCIHFNSLQDAFKGNLLALKHNPVAIELMDKTVLDLTKDNIEQNKNRFFVEGDPFAILIVEFAFETREEILQSAKAMETEMRAAGLGYHFPMVDGDDIRKVWNLRKAGLGVLSNLPGDAKPVAVIEDTAILPTRLPDFIAELDEMLAGHNLSCVYYAHIATGELHLRPILNLKDPKDVELFRTVGLETARLVKKYKGSLSGEHGDGRLRGEFIPIILGDHNYRLLERLKKTWDPQGIFNPGKITATPVMNTSLRYEPGKPERKLETVFDFSKDQGFLRAIEKCNGSGDCRKTEIIGGTMCPSYMASRDENTTTRARANILRDYLTNSDKQNPFDHKEIYDVLDLCLSCKGCKSECPSSVDMAKYKAEFLQHYYDAHSIPLRTQAIANISTLNRLGSIAPGIYNFFMSNPGLSDLFKKSLGFATERSMPLLAPTRFTMWNRRYRQQSGSMPFRKKVYLFADEFTEFNDTHIGITTVKLLNRLGYEVIIPMHLESGRTFLSKGLVRKAKDIAIKNVLILREMISKDIPLLGIEPSAILTFRDEYLDLTGPELKEDTKKLAANCYMVDEFIAKEFDAGNISSDQFTRDALQIKLHGHCHQKSLASTLPTRKMLSIPGKL